MLSSGTSSQAGAYFIRGDANLAAGAVPARFAEFRPLALSAPAAATTTPDRAFLAFTDVGKVELATFDAQFKPVGAPATLELTPSGTVLWLAPVGGVTTAGLVVGTGSSIDYVQADAAEFTIASTLAPPVVLGATYNDGGNQTLLVASATAAQSVVLAPTGTLGAWTSVRTGAVWVAQTAVDLDGDGYPELVGYDPAMHAVCAVELTMNRVACVPLTTTSQLDAASIVVADLLGGSALDIAIAFSGADTSDLALLGDISYDGQTLAAAAQSFSPGLVLPKPHWFAIARGPTHKTSLVVAGPDGYMGCPVCL